jgi:hypothetical protein
VKARVQVVLGAESLAERIKLRLSYQDGEGPLRANPWQTPNLGGKYVEVDLGVITTTTAIAGTQKWLGQIEAYSENGIAKDVLHVNYLTFVPVGEGLYGKARGAQSSAPGSIAAFDNFTTGTLGGSLNTRTPAVGAAWATSGATTDFTVESGLTKRSTTSDAGPRYAVLGAALGNSSASFVGQWSTQAEKAALALMLRWVSAESFAFIRATREIVGSHTTILVELGVKVAGVTTVLASNSYTLSGKAAITFTASLTAALDGSLSTSGYFTMLGSNLDAFALSGSSSAVATGGTLASGKAGAYDQNAGSTACTRSVSSIQASTLAAIPYVIQPSQSMEVRSDSTITEDSSGTYTGPVPLYRGSRFYVPQDGSANRTSRIVVKTDRNDLEASDEQTIADTFTAAVFATPRFGVIPR